MIPAHLVPRITLVLCLTLVVTAGLCPQGLAQPGQPVISMDSAQYCIGDSWKFTLSNGVPNTPVSLLGSSNGQSWEIREWGKTDAAGNFSMEGTFAAADAFGSHTLTLDIGGTVSNTISLVVSDCSQAGRITMNLAEYCAGDSWKFTLSNGVPNTRVHLLGSSNGQSWQIREWGTTDAAGNFSAEGTFNADALGNHTLKLDIRGRESNTLSLVISDCKLTGRIAFASTRDGGAAAGHLAVPYIYVANPDGSGVTRLTRGASPAWSRDGQRIAFHSWIGGSINSGSPEIRVINADGSNERVLGRGLYPSWSPDGTKIAFFYSAIGLEGGIFMMNADGSGVTLLISNDFANPGWGDYAVEMPAWSPDGGSIAFVRANYEDPWTVHILDLATSEIRLLPLPLSVGDSRPSWSPDGTKLLLQVPSWRISSVNRDGSDFKDHLKAGYLGNPDWSPDGRGIVFERFTGPGDRWSSVGSRMRIFVTNLADGSVRQLIPDAVAPAVSDYWDSDPVWSRVRK